MNAREVHANVTEYRRLSALMRSIKARQRPLRGQRSSVTIFSHGNAMQDILVRLKGNGHEKLAQQLSLWHDNLFRAVSASEYGAKQYRAEARTLSAGINASLKAMKPKQSRTITRTEDDE